MGDIAYISWGEDFIAKCSFVYYLSRLFCTKYFYMKLIFSEDVYDRIFKRIVICSNFRPVLKKKTWKRKRIVFVDQLLVMLIWKNIRFIYYPKEYLVNLSNWPYPWSLDCHVIYCTAPITSEWEQHAWLKKEMEQTTGRFLLLVKVLVRDLQTRESWSRVNYEQKLSEQSSSFEDARVVGKTKDTRQDFWLGCATSPRFSKSRSHFMRKRLCQGPPLPCVFVILVFRADL